MNLRLLSLALATFACANINALTQWPEIDIRNNKVELVTDQIKICRYNEAAEEVVCVTHDGEPIRITDVKTVVGSSTGTPPWLDANLKGTYVGQSIDSVGTKAGSGKRTIYLKD